MAETLDERTLRREQATLNLTAALDELKGSPLAAVVNCRIEALAAEDRTDRLQVDLRALMRRALEAGVLKAQIARALEISPGRVGQILGGR